MIAFFLPNLISTRVASTKLTLFILHSSVYIFATNFLGNLTPSRLKPHKRNLETKTRQPQQHLSENIIDNSDNHKKSKPRRISSLDEWDGIFSYFLLVFSRIWFLWTKTLDDSKSEKPTTIMKWFFCGKLFLFLFWCVVRLREVERGKPWKCALFLRTDMTTVYLKHSFLNRKTINLRMK